MFATRVSLPGIAGFRASKSLSQNFLADGEVAQRILELLPGEPRHVVEIGAGPGTMTRGLAERGEVAAIELDPRLVQRLRSRFGSDARVEVVEGDALEVDIAHLTPAPYAIVGNIPYHITGLLVPRLLRLEPRPEWVCLMVQEEVADRLAAAPGSWSLATLAVRTAATAEVVLRVPREAFDPVPRVDSAVVLMRPTPLAPFADDGFFSFARAVFQERRKKLPNAVANALGHDVERAREVVARTRLDPMRRPQTLDLDEWEALYRAFRDGA